MDTYTCFQIVSLMTLMSGGFLIFRKLKSSNKRQSFAEFQCIKTSSGYIPCISSKYKIKSSSKLIALEQKDGWIALPSIKPKYLGLDLVTLEVTKNSDRFVFEYKANDFIDLIELEEAFEEKLKKVHESKSLMEALD